jgi:predicted  nucleic acid-binding Zn-ribbon protein
MHHVPTPCVLADVVALVVQARVMQSMRDQLKGYASKMADANERAAKLRDELEEALQARENLKHDNAMLQEKLHLVQMRYAKEVRGDGD